jgi:tRNA nucleotidyltransferase/poly(A) polymerase
MLKIVPEKQHRFAVEVVRTLREAGFTSYLAGGCVRDQLLGRTPHDYDVATDATPEQVRGLFTHRRTLAIGAAFGVISVLGPRGAGAIEVATFRRDAAYSDGRHPDSVTYSDAREDALRRDFTINGLFYDPVEEAVIDFVGGQEDLAAGLIRAIGEPGKRFAEDKLRLLRAVRFAAAFGFALEDRTHHTIREMAAEVTVVSAERIAAEIRRMLVSSGRATAVRLLLDTRLADAVLPEIVPKDQPGRDRLERTLALLDRLRRPSFSLALAALLHGWVDARQAEQACRRWKLPNKVTERTAWLVAEHGSLAGAESMRWSALQKRLVSPGIEELLSLAEAAASADDREATEVDFCREVLAWPRETLDPPPLVTGDDLGRRGLLPGPAYRTLLARIRDAQLDGEVHTKHEALALADRLISQERSEHGQEAEEENAHPERTASETPPAVGRRKETEGR